MQLPALAIKQPDLGKALMRAAQIKSLGMNNKLTEAKLKHSADLTDALSEYARPPQAPDLTDPGYTDPGYDSAPQEPAPQGTPDAGGAAQAAQVNRQSGSPMDNPAWAKINALDPKVGKMLLDNWAASNGENRKQLEQQNEMTASLLAPIESLPPEQRALAYAQTLAKAQQMGVPMQGVPQQYDPLWVRQKLAMAQGVKEYLAAEADTVKVYGPGGKLRWVPKYQTPHLPKGSKPYEKPEGAQSPIGKLAADRGSGIITDEEYKTGIGIAKKPLVQMGEEGAESKAYGKKMGEYYAERFTGTQKAAATARASNARLDRLDQLLDQTATGKFIATSVEIQKAAKTLGIDLSGLPGNVAPAEAAIALTNAMALELRSSMPGPMSDSDRDFLVSMAPGLGQTAEGRKLLIGTRRKVNKRLFKISKMAREYTSRNGRLDAGFEEELQAYSDKNPMFTKEDMSSREKSRLPSVTDDAGFHKLAPGTYFRDPEGKVRQKPNG